MINSLDIIKLTTKGYEAYEHSATKVKSEWLPFLGTLEGKNDWTIEELVENHISPQKSSPYVIIKELLDEGLVRIDPYINPSQLSIKTNLSKSINEEAIAASVYRQRKATADPTTAKLYEHIASEEDGHRAEFSKRISELESDKAKIKYNALGGYIA